MVLMILQWIRSSLIANSQELKHFVLNLQDKPHVICIQETWLKPEWDFVIQYMAIQLLEMTGSAQWDKVYYN